MRKIVIILVIFSILTFIGCGQTSYIFNNSLSEIKEIEIVDAENSLDFTVIKVLSDEEMGDFLEKFKKIKFNTYYIGDPMAVNGISVKITYNNNDYEMICHYWSEYVKDGEIYFVRQSCDEIEFIELLNNYLNQID